MNWYSIFYWITVADGVKSFFDTFSNIFTFLTIIFVIILFVIRIAYSEYKDKSTEEAISVKYWLKRLTNMTLMFVILTTLTWAGYVFIPTKKDCLLIVAGGAVGNFITTDTSVKQMPSEVLLLLRTKIKSEIEELNPKNIQDTLQNKSKEELINLIKQK